MKDVGSPRLVAVGDIMLGRGVRRTGVPDATELVAPDLLGRLDGDIVTGNLECLIGFRGTPNPASHSHFQGDPEMARPLLELFDVVSVANNHFGDFGDDAVDETLDWLDKIGVRHVGIGNSAEAAADPAIFHIAERKIAIFGATTVGNLPANSRYVMATPGRDLYRRVEDLSGKGYRCILHLHAGGGDVCHPAPSIRRLMSEVRQAGFSLVFGHHPHVAQGVDKAASGVVFFSLGDFVFDKLEDGRDQALALTIAMGATVSEDKIEVDIVQRGDDLRLSLLSGSSKEIALRRFHDLSREISSGASDTLYLEWRGSKWKRFLQSIRADWKAGGLGAVAAKVQRIDARKLTDLLFRR